jgi:PAS domain S-box-containing protein
MNTAAQDGSFFPARTSIRSSLIWIASIAAIYFITARLSLLLLFQPQGIAPIWPPEGVFLSAMILTQPRLRPYLAGVLFITDFLAEVLAGIPLFVSFVYALSLTFDAVLSSWILFRILGRQINFSKTIDMLWFLLIPVLAVNCAVSFLTAAAAQTLPGSSFWNSWRWWAASDGVGNILITPLIISLVHSTSERRKRPLYVLEGILLLSLLIAQNLIMFGFISDEGQILFFTILSFPFLIWAALRFGVRGVSLSMLALAVIAVFFAATRQDSGITLLRNKLDNIITVQLYIVFLGVPSLFLAAAVVERREINEKLALLHERFNLAVVSSGIGVWDWDIVKNELFWDDTMYTLYGIKREDFSGAYEAWLAGLHPDDRGIADELSKLTRSGQGEYDTEFRVVWPNGSIHFLKANGKVTYAEDGAAIRMTGINFDITERKTMSERLADSYRYIRAILENTPVGIGTYKASGEAISINPALAKIAGEPLEKLEKQNFRLLESWKASGMLSAAEEAIATGIEKSIETHSVSTFGEEHWLSCIFIPFIHEGEQHLLLIVNDITGRMSAEKKLKESEELYRLVSELTADYIFKVRVDSKSGLVLEYTSENLERITGRTIDSVRTQT